MWVTPRGRPELCRAQPRREAMGTASRECPGDFPKEPAHTHPLQVSTVVLAILIFTLKATALLLTSPH